MSTTDHAHQGAESRFPSYELQVQRLYGPLARGFEEAVRAAASAVEIFGEDDLEAHAARLRDVGISV